MLSDSISLIFFLRQLKYNKQSNKFDIFFYCFFFLWRRTA